MSDLAPDEVLVRGLELRACVGVTEAERQTPQRLTVSLGMQPIRGFDNLEDDLKQTVNYSAVCRMVKVLAAARPRHLIETLALDIAESVLAQFPCAVVEVELRKFVLPDTEHVAVRVVRRRL